MSGIRIALNSAACGKRRPSSKISPVTQEQRTVLMGIVVLALAAAAGLAYATTVGPTGYSDSAAYLVAGRNLAQGAGLGYPQPDGSFYTLTHYPPLYTATFSVYTWLGLDLVNAGRWFNIVALAASVITLAWLFIRFSAVPLLALLAGLLLMAFPATTGVFASLMSDGPFLTLLLLSMLALLHYVDRPSRLGLVAALLLAASLPLMRYVGLVFVASSALILFIFLEGSRRQRLKQAVDFALAALLPVGLWLAWVYLSVDASLGGRGGVESGLLALFQQFRAYFTDTIWQWIPFARVPSTLPYWLRQIIFLALGVGAVGLTLRLGRQPTDGDEHEAERPLLFWTFAISGAAYLLGLAGAFVFTAPAPDISDRTLLPFFVCVLGTLLALAAQVIAQRPDWKRWAWAATLATGLLFVAAFSDDTLEMAQELNSGSQGFFTQRWRDSDTIQAVRALPAGQIIVADRAAALLYWADRPAYELLEVSDDDLTLAAAHGDLLVVFADFPSWMQRVRGPQESVQVAGVTDSWQILQTFDDGAIYSREP